LPFADYFIIAGVIKPDATNAEKRLDADDTRTVMLSGDKLAVIEIVVKPVSIGGY